MYVHISQALEIHLTLTLIFSWVFNFGNLVGNAIKQHFFSFKIFQIFGGFWWVFDTHKITCPVQISHWPWAKKNATSFWNFIKLKLSFFCTCVCLPTPINNCHYIFFYFFANLHVSCHYPVIIGRPKILAKKGNFQDFAFSPRNWKRKFEGWR